MRVVASESQFQSDIKLGYNDYVHHEFFKIVFVNCCYKLEWITRP